VKKLEFIETDKVRVKVDIKPVEGQVFFLDGSINYPDVAEAGSTILFKFSMKNIGDVEDTFGYRLTDLDGNEIPDTQKVTSLKPDEVREFVLEYQINPPFEGHLSIGRVVLEGGE